MASIGEGALKSGNCCLEGPVGIEFGEQEVENSLKGFGAPLLEDSLGYLAGLAL